MDGHVMLNPDARKNLLVKAEGWIQKAEKERDPFDKYMSYFISFKILYDIYAKEMNPSADLSLGDSRRAVEVGNLIPDKEALVNDLKQPLRDYLEIIPAFREEYWGRPHPVPIASRLREAFYSDNAADTIEYLLKWLYKVRCNVVHGGKNYDEKLDKTILDYSNKMIARILSDVLAEYRRRFT
jgi:hypothetical protein